MQMSVSPSKVLTNVLERIEVSHPASANFLMTDIDHWPEGTLEKLAKSGLFQLSEHAAAIVCPGCERQCHKKVSSRKTVSGEVSACIICDEAPAHGIIFVSDQERTQFRTSL